MNWSRRIAGIFERQPQDLDVGHAIDAGLKRLRQEERLESALGDPLAPLPSRWNDLTEPLKDALGLRKSILFSAPRRAGRFPLQQNARMGRHGQPGAFRSRHGAL